MAEAAVVREGRAAVTDVAESARGWNGIQLAVLAFIGFCGVITDARPDLPGWLQATAALLSLLALAIACVAVYLVASVAWPRSASPTDTPVEASNQHRRTSRRLRLGSVLTFAAVAVMALAASANWWPVSGDDGSVEDGTETAEAPLVEARDRAGNRWCGRLVASERGAVLIATVDGNTELQLDGLVSVQAIQRC